MKIPKPRRKRVTEDTFVGLVPRRPDPLESLDGWRISPCATDSRDLRFLKQDDGNLPAPLLHALLVLAVERLKICSAPAAEAVPAGLRNV